MGMSTADAYVELCLSKELDGGGGREVVAEIMGVDEVPCIEGGV